MNQPVSFEIAKMLKEKGFSNRTINHYFEDGIFRQNSLTGTNGYYGDEYEHVYSEFLENWNDKEVTKKDGSRCFGCSKDKGYFETFSAPDIHEVVMWMYEKHEVWIRVEPDWHNDFWAQIKSRAVPDARIGKWVVITALAPYKSPTEAYEAAIEYVLTHLI